MEKEDVSKKLQELKEQAKDNPDLWHKIRLIEVDYDAALMIADAFSKNEIWRIEIILRYAAQLKHSIINAGKMKDFKDGGIVVRPDDRSDSK